MYRMEAADLEKVNKYAQILKFTPICAALALKIERKSSEMIFSQDFVP